MNIQDFVNSLDQKAHDALNSPLGQLATSFGPGAILKGGAETLINEPKALANVITGKTKMVGKNQGDLIKQGYTQDPAQVAAQGGAEDALINGALTTGSMGLAGLQMLPSSGSTPPPASAVAAESEPAVATAEKEAVLPPIANELPKGRAGVIRVPFQEDANGALKQANSQAAIDDLPGNNAIQKYQSMNKQLGDLDKQIKVFNAAHPVSVSGDDVRNTYLKQMQPLMAAPGTSEIDAQKMGMITPDKAEFMADNYIRQMQLAAGLDITMDPSTQTGTYTIDQITDMKKAANGLNKGLLSARAAGNNLTPEQKMQLANVDTLDGVIKQYQPAIKDLSMEQSGLYYGLDALTKAANEEAKNLPANLAEKAGNILKNPLFGIPAAAIGLTEAKNIPDLLGKGIVAGQAGLKKIGSLLNPSGDKALAAGEVVTQPTVDRYTFDNPLTNGIVQGGADFAQTQGDLQAKIAQEKLNNPQQANTDQGIFDKNQTRYTAQSQVRDVAQNTQTLLSQANEAASALDAVDPSFVNALSQGYDSLSKASDGKYAALAATLNALDQSSPVDLTTAKTKESLMAAIDKIVENQKKNLKAATTAYGGSTAPQATLPKVSAAPPQTTPSQALPSDFQFGASYLPPIQ